ncbi:DUF4369 domain-containing protein [Flavobacterium succinicans]|uniref:DUF4369 domain-containing protein n=1 Tax=Flavobacterium succinicans TaxID=29536 RepID=A0A199XT25_9FLAO|nr:DUF4369 domain-containing protein [Flavobacterium succinicans]OAZ04572.1 hypothetical protein FLB_04140 [Flavobacterium succinicans]
MKKTILALVALTSIIACTKNESKNNLHLTGNVVGLKKGTLYIQRLKDTTLITIDSIKIEGDSKFETNIPLESPEMFYLSLNRGVSNSLDNNLLFFAEPGNINIETNLDSFLYGAKITGSENHDLYEEFVKINSQFKDENLNIIEQKFKATKFKNIKKLDSLKVKEESNIKRRYLYATNFAVNHKDHEVAPYIALSEIYDINIKFLDTIQKSMTPKVAQSLYGKKLTKFVNDIKKQE